MKLVGNPALVDKCSIVVGYAGLDLNDVNVSTRRLTTLLWLDEKIK